MSEISKQGWPDNFDFRTDPVCQEKFRPFIEAELEKLRAYDDMRSADITYIFHQHAVRVANNARKTCLHMGLGDVVANNMYWAMLPHDIGKRKLPVEVWDTEEKPTGDVKNFRRTHTDLGVEIVEETFPDLQHPFKDLVIDIMRNHHEQMDGKGFRGLKDGQLSLPVRMAAIVEAYDGWRIWRPHFRNRDISIPGVLHRMLEEKGSSFFDMDILDAFAEVKMKEQEKRAQ